MSLVKMKKCNINFIQHAEIYTIIFKYLTILKYTECVRQMCTHFELSLKRRGERPRAP